MIIISQLADDIAASARTLHASFSREFTTSGSTLPADAVRAAVPVLLRHELNRAEPQPAPEPGVLCRYCRQSLALVHGRWYAVTFWNARSDLAGRLLCTANTGGAHVPQAGS